MVAPGVLAPYLDLHLVALLGGYGPAQGHRVARHVEELIVDKFVTFMKTSK